jgi:hypothetical protein
MQFARIRQLLGLLLSISSLLLLVYAIWPARREIRELHFSIQELSQATPSGSSASYQFPEARQLRLDWPENLRMGEMQEIGLVLESQTAVEALADGMNIYEDYKVLLEARLEIPGVPVAPPGEYSQPIKQGQPVEFEWQVHPSEQGYYQGQVWLHLLFVPYDSGDIQRQLLSVQEIPLRAVGLKWPSLAAAQVIGIVGIVIGGVLCLDLAITLVRKAIWGSAGQG